MADSVGTLLNSEPQIIRREGEYWTIAYGGEICRLKDTRGLRHLAVLLRRPHEPMAALAVQCAGGGRARPAPNAGTGMNTDRASCERARVNVTRALRGALARIATHHPGLARHLQATLRTGTFCTYTPDPRVPAVWES